ncbi:unnamed protein product [Soboliphyme baturini]|uniref:PPIase cyclophilin-type domain-containing protein n=1 Tax=Soboliphyme baturini TaxID=241478 RepID=A0A183IH25_9BILA|nr:unnamed protein product [Soboliphyme baturini]
MCLVATLLGEVVSSEEDITLTFEVMDSRIPQRGDLTFRDGSSNAEKELVDLCYVSSRGTFFELLVLDKLYWSPGTVRNAF